VAVREFSVPTYTSGR